MKIDEWCKRVEQLHWVLKFTGQIEQKPEAEERLIQEDKKLLGIKDE